MAGACLRASWNRSRTRAAPTPTNISTKLEPVTEKNGTLASPATARASRVLPVPGGPTIRTPRGCHGPGPGEPLGLLEEVDHLADLDLGPLVAGHVGEGRLRALLVEDLGLRAPDPQRPLHPTHGPLGEPPPEVAEHEEGEQQDHPGEDLGAEGGARLVPR